MKKTTRASVAIESKRRQKYHLTNVEVSVKYMYFYIEKTVSLEKYILKLTSNSIWNLDLIVLSLSMREEGSLEMSDTRPAAAIAYILSETGLQFNSLIMRA